MTTRPASALLSAIEASGLIKNAHAVNIAATAPAAADRFVVMATVAMLRFISQSCCRD
jgi:hypothetical protein